jgi:hypothetical protein
VDESQPVGPLAVIRVRFLDLLPTGLSGVISLRRLFLRFEGRATCLGALLIALFSIAVESACLNVVCVIENNFMVHERRKKSTAE